LLRTLLHTLTSSIDLTAKQQFLPSKRKERVTKEQRTEKGLLEEHHSKMSGAEIERVHRTKQERKVNRNYIRYEVK